MASYSVDPTKKTTNNTQNPYDFAGVSVSQLSLIRCNALPNYRQNHLLHLIKEPQAQDSRSELPNNAWEPP